MFYIRIDVNNHIGMGHAMRCLSIADALKQLGEEIIFITADDNGKALIEDRGYEIACLNQRWDEPEQELEKLVSYVQINSGKCILVDKYEVTERYLKELQKVIKVVYIDDLNKFIYPCDALISYANYYEKFQYEKQYEKDVKLLLGPRYVPLRKEYSNRKEKKITDRGNHVVFLSGGTDNYGVALAFLKELNKQQVLGTYQIRIICGAFHKDIEVIQKMAKNHENIEVLVQVKDMWNYMEWADIAISAGGTTLYELSACGTPFISYSIADNQLDNVRCFEKENHIYYAGDMRENLQQNMEKLVSKLNFLREDKGQREMISKSLQQLVDGNGSLCIAKALCDWIEQRE